MATNTYVALDKQVLTSTTTAVTFSSILAGYTDLRLVTVVKGVSGDWDLTYRFNSDSGSNYSRTVLTGNGTTANSYRETNQTYLRPDVDAYVNSSTWQFVTTDFMNYSNSTTYKTSLSRVNGGATPAVEGTVGLWRSTAAITSITVELQAGSGTFAVGSTFSLYGIAAEGVSPAPKATGGAIYSDSTYYYHVFGSTGTFTPLSSLTADILTIAGGGGGAYGGGGAGGLLYTSSQSLASSTAYTCTIGAGGAGIGSNDRQAASNGSGSTFIGGAVSLTALSGGGGGGSINTTARNGLNGGSGGGAGFNYGGGTGGTGTSGQGYAGANSAGDNYSAGGGGAGAVGTGTTSSSAGGVGSSTYSSWGIATGTGQNVSGTYYYAGGGSGGADAPTASAGGYGGGGAGSNSVDGTKGTANTGGGGGGGARGNTYVGAAGGSGIVIVRYAK